METAEEKSLSTIKNYNKIIFVFIFSVILYIVAGINNAFFVDIMSVTSYLTWHIIFEFASILVSFSIFAVTYFVYEESGRLRIIILGCTFLAMGFLDAFHALSYKGMSHFFIANDTANRATSLWILSRTIGSLGFLASIFIPSHTTSKIKKRFFAATTIIVSIILFLIITYYPDFFPPMYIEGEGMTTIKILMEYVIIFIMGVTFLRVCFEYNRTNSYRDYMLMMALMLLIFSEFAFTNYGSVYDAFNYIGHIYKVIAHLLLYKAIYIENISIPYREMKKARQELKEYSDNLNMIVEMRTRQLEEMNKALLADIDNAKEMQRSLLPMQMPQDSSLSFHAQYYAAERLSGDFYNVIKLDEKNIALYIGDVSGHGVSAALLTVFANQNIKPLKEKEGFSPEIIEPGFVLKTVYKNFNRTNFNIEKYIVMLYGIYNIESKCFTYSSAGINVPPYIIKKSGEVLELDAKGFPICKLGDVNLPFYDNRNIQLEIGDKVLFYSDGLVEATDKDGDSYGQGRMKAFLESNFHLGPIELDMAIKNNLFNHIGNYEKLMDDATYLIMEIKA